LNSTTIIYITPPATMVSIEIIKNKKSLFQHFEKRWNNEVVPGRTSTVPTRVVLGRGSISINNVSTVYHLWDSDDHSSIIKMIVLFFFIYTFLQLFESIIQTTWFLMIARHMISQSVRINGVTKNYRKLFPLFRFHTRIYLCFLPNFFIYSNILEST